MANILSTFGRGLAKVPGVLRDALTEETYSVPSDVPFGQSGPDYVVPSRRVRPVVRDAIIGFMAGASTPNVAYGGGTDIMRGGLAGLGAVQDQEDRRTRIDLAKQEEARRERAMQAQAEFDRARAQEALLDAETRKLRAETDALGSWVQGSNGVWKNTKTGEERRVGEGDAPVNNLFAVRAPSGDMTADMDYAKPIEDAMTKQVFQPYGEVVPVTPAVHSALRAYDASLKPAPPKPPAVARVESIRPDGRKVTEFVEAKPGTTYTSQGVASSKRPGGAGKPQAPSVDQLADEIIERAKNRTDNPEWQAKTFADVVEIVRRDYQDDPRVARVRDAIEQKLISRARRIIGKKPTESIDLAKVPLPGVKVDAPAGSAKVEPPPSSFVSTMKTGQIVDDAETGAAWQKQADGSVKRIK